MGALGNWTNIAVPLSGTRRPCGVEVSSRRQRRGTERSDTLPNVPGSSYCFLTVLRGCGSTTLERWGEASAIGKGSFCCWVQLAAALFFAAPCVGSLRLQLGCWLILRVGPRDPAGLLGWDEQTRGSEATEPQARLGVYDRSGYQLLKIKMLPRR